MRNITMENKSSIMAMLRGSLISATILPLTLLQTSGLRRTQESSSLLCATTAEYYALGGF